MDAARRDERLIAAASFTHYALTVGGGIALLAWTFPREPLVAPVAAAGGWVWGAAAEYTIHRFLLHDTRAFSRLHARHHAEPHRDQIDAVSYFSPMAIWACAWLIVHAATLDPVAASATVAGGMLQYAWFRALHRIIHAPWRPAWLDGVARDHDRHHADVRCNFSVTARHWDRVFRTFRRSDAQ